MNLKKLSLCLLALTFCVSMFACSGQRVTRVNNDQPIDLSGNWNDTDSRLVSQEMITDALGSAWLRDFTEKQGRRPVVIVGDVLNMTEEHINTGTFVQDLARNLTNSGRVTFVASRDQREALRDERADQAEHARASTVSQQGNETGADFMLKGQISSMLDTGSGAQLIVYQVDLEMINIETNERVWMGNKTIRKVVSRNRFRA
ncbi:MAG: penicillin-binding protein activator LpoB [Endomicrobia bacterium]|nr:penicillin-binding protein activator LpoB [Endomicrobiia bacterium]MCL2507096.1 penicillin-binding protein activator LpoB [Endomicrobiia bacterium]